MYLEIEITQPLAPLDQPRPFCQPGEVPFALERVNPPSVRVKSRVTDHEPAACAGFGGKSDRKRIPIRAVRSPNRADLDIGSTVTEHFGDASDYHRDQANTDSDSEDDPENGE